MECLYFICERKFYARTRVKITRHWKPTLIVRKDRNPFAAVGNFSYTRAGGSRQAKYKNMQSKTNWKVPPPPSPQKRPRKQWPKLDWVSVRGAQETDPVKDLSTPYEKGGLIPLVFQSNWNSKIKGFTGWHVSVSYPINLVLKSLTTHFRWNVRIAFRSMIVQLCNLSTQEITAPSL